MTNKSVFLIKTPLQLLNAIEAKYHFDLKTDDCILIIMGDRKSQPQILMLANSVDEWGKVIVLNSVNIFFGSAIENASVSLSKKGWKSKFLSKSFFNVRRLNRISKYYGEVEYIFIGYARSIYMRHFSNITPHKKVLILDDGNATIQIAKDRVEKRSPPRVSLKKRFKLFGKRFFQGIKDCEKESLIFFTIYDISVRKNDHVIRNNFDHIRSRVGLLDETDEVYFLGSPLDEAGIMNQSDYLKHLRRVKNYYSDKNIVYIAHRRENPENLKKIGNDLGVKVVLFNYPIEYQLTMIGPRPKVLASFISSALDNCRKIFEGDLKVISFKLDLKDSLREKEIESIYNGYESISDENFIVESEY